MRNGFGAPQGIEATTENPIVDYNVRAFHSGADMSKAESIEEMSATTLEAYYFVTVLAWRTNLCSARD